MIQNDDKKVMLMANRVFTVMEKRVSAEDAVRIPILFGLYSLLKIRNFKFRLVPGWKTVVKYVVVVSLYAYIAYRLDTIWLFIRYIL